MATDLVCFSHLRWDFVFQRPNHLMTRAAASRRVHFVEEVAWTAHAASDELHVVQRHGVEVLTPVLAGSWITRAGSTGAITWDCGRASARLPSWHATDGPCDSACRPIR